MKVHAPTVSVCIPTYNGAATIAAAIASVLLQTFPDFELIVVDDGSPDNTCTVVERFSDPRLVFLRNEHNLGPQGNWNRCLELAKGRYFKLLPHDDVLHPACLAQQVRVLENDPDERIALVFSARDVISPDGRVLMRRGYPRGREGIIPGRVVMLYMCAPWNQCGRRARSCAIPQITCRKGGKFRREQSIRNRSGLLVSPSHAW